MKCNCINFDLLNPTFVSCYVKSSLTCVCLMAIVSVLTTGCSSQSDPKTDSAQSSNEEEDMVDDPEQAESTREVERPTEIVKFEAQQYISDFESDDEALKEKCKDKLVEIKGKVSDVFAYDPHGKYKPGIFLVDPASTSLVDNVTCITLDKTPWKSLSEGSMVTVQGTWRKDDFFLIRPWLSNCEIVANEGEPVPHLNAEEFVKQVLADPELAREKYNSEQIVLTGKLKEIAFDVGIKGRGFDGYRVDILIEGSDEFDIACHTTEEYLFRGKRPGDFVKLLGTGKVSVSTSESEEHQIGISHTFVLKSE